MSNHFASLERDDLREHCSDVDMHSVLSAPGHDPLYSGDGDVVLLLTESDALDQALITDYEWSSDCGVSFWLLPLAHGPVQETV